MADFSYLDGIAEGQLRLQRCAECGQVRQLPSPMCPACHSVAWDEAPASGHGTIWAWAINSRSSATPPPILAIVQLEEGPKLTTSLVDVDPASVKVGMPVQAVYLEEDGIKLLQFAPAA